MCLCVCIVCSYKCRFIQTTSRHTISEIFFLVSIHSLGGKTYGGSPLIRDVSKMPSPRVRSHFDFLVYLRSEKWDQQKCPNVCLDCAGVDGLQRRPSPKGLQKVSKRNDFFAFFGDLSPGLPQCDQNGAQRWSNEAQWCPNGAPRCPNGAPRWPNGAPRCPNGAPR